MKGQTIGKTMPNGYAGSYSRQPDMIVDTHPAEGEIGFGDAVAYKNSGVIKLDPIQLGISQLSTSVLPTLAEKFVGIAIREVKSATNYADQNEGSYAENEATPVMKRGRVNVICQNGTPALNGDVYIRLAENASISGAVVGGLEAEADGNNSVKLTNAKWRGSADANGVAELSILTQNNA